ncbi:MAG: hypothetical protein IJM45_09870 [Clostridia bacterium]|nr:hypothetical protein [Clostridia bacterium]
MESVATFFKRLIGIITTLSMAFAMLVSEHSAKPEYTPGEPPEQSPFSCVPETDADASAAEDIALAFNAVYRLFGGVDTEHTLVFRHGNEPTWFEWMALKTTWCRDEAFLRGVKDRIRDFPQTDNGYLWSWSDSPCWHSGNGVLHYDGLFRYVAAVADILRWAGDTSFLDETDGNTYGGDLSVDASLGRTVYEKCALAMSYAENELYGGSGIITLTEKSAYLADGVTRFDIGADGTPVWNNTGRAGSSPSNYWDNLCFGNQDAYETALYYHALCAMRDIELMRGDAEAAAQCEALAAKVKQRFDEVFWNRCTGRYIACVDVDGKRWDPGLTFLNVEALAYGLGDAEKAKRIFSWLDGERIVPTDSLRGKQITDYALFLNRNCGVGTAWKPMPFAPATNTVSIEKLSGLGEPWWHSLDGAITTGFRSNAFYGQHLENGGYIFYPVFYELTARGMYLGADSVKRRARELAEVYRFNGFDSDVGGWAEGLTGEFPESGIVERAFISTLTGVEASVDGLTVRPGVPSGIKTLGVDALRFRGVPIEVTVGADELTLTSESALSGVLRFYPSAAGEYAVSVTSADGTVSALIVRTDAGGAISVDPGDYGAVRVDIRRF